MFGIDTHRNIYIYIVEINRSIEIERNSQKAIETQWNVIDTHTNIHIYPKNQLKYMEKHRHLKKSIEIQ